VVEVKFTKDGTPLNVSNPHLIVVKQGGGVTAVDHIVAIGVLQKR
jgi:hypothetical protein